MIQKPKGNKKIAKPIKPIKSPKSVKKFTSSETANGNSGPIHKTKDKAINEAYDRGFNDGYSKGLEDGGLDESK